MRRNSSRPAATQLRAPHVAELIPAPSAVDEWVLVDDAAGLGEHRVEQRPKVAVDSRHEGVLTPEGYVDTWSGRESVIVRTRAPQPIVRANTKLSLRLLSVAREARPVPSVDGIEARTISEPAEAKTSTWRRMRGLMGEVPWRLNRRGDETAHHNVAARLPPYPPAGR